MANDLTESLARVNEFVAAIRERAFDELATLHGDATAVDVGAVMEAPGPTGQIVLARV